MWDVRKTAATTTSAGPLSITMKVMAMRVYIIMRRQDKTRLALQERKLLRVFPCNNTETGARVREKAGQQARTASKFPDDNGNNKCIKCIKCILFSCNKLRYWVFEDVKMLSVTITTTPLHPFDHCENRDLRPWTKMCVSDDGHQNSTCNKNGECLHIYPERHAQNSKITSACFVS